MNMFELLKASKGLAVSDSYTALLGRKISGGGSFPETEITGMTPLTFLSNGDAIKAWTIYGKTVQNGTPTPDAPIEVKGVGERTANLFSKTNTVNGYFTNDGATFITPSTGRITAYVQCKPNTTYTLKKMATSRFVIATSSAAPTKDAIINNHYISASTTTITINTGENDYYIWMWIFFDVIDTEIDLQDVLDSLQVNLGSTALPYEPYGYKVGIVNNDETAATVYLDAPLYDGDFIERKADGSGVLHANDEDTPITLPEIATAEGTNVLDTNTTVKPSSMSITGKIKPVT